MEYGIKMSCSPMSPNFVREHMITLQDEKTSARNIAQYGVPLLIVAGDV